MTFLFYGSDTYTNDHIVRDQSAGNFSAPARAAKPPKQGPSEAEWRAFDFAEDCLIRTNRHSD